MKMFKQHIKYQWLLCLVLASIVTGMLVIYPKADTNEVVSTNQEPAEQLQESNVKTKYVYEDNDKIVTATLQNANSIPENALLRVDTITQESSPNQYSQFKTLVGGISDQQTPNEIRGCDFCAYDIYFLFENKEIEPADGSVTVTIEYKQQIFASGDNSDVAVYHVIGDGSEAALSSVDTNANLSDSGLLDTVEFATDSFSVFLVTNGYTMSNSLSYSAIDNSDETFINTPYYNPKCALGIAGNFHIVAFGTATLNTHTNGNLLAYNLYVNSNFGTNGLTNELSYVQNYLKVAGNSASSSSHVLALGSGNTVSLIDNGNTFAINGTKLDSPKNIYQDADTSSLPFIDFNMVKTDIAAKSTMMGEYSDANINNSLSTSGGDCNTSYLTLTDTDGIGVYSISGAMLSSYNYMGIKGFTSGNDGSVIINVNCEGLSAVTMPTALMYVNGVAQITNEVTTFENGKIIWNFINASGVTITSKQMTGTIIAVGATVNISQNINGTVIAENVNVNAESHRTDFTGKINETIEKTVTKIWDDNNNQQSIRPNSIAIQLMADGNNFGDTVTLNEANNWSYTWPDLPKYINGTSVIYTVKEVDTINGYTASYSADTFTITNSITYYGFSVLKVSTESEAATLAGAEFRLEKLTESNTVDPLFTASVVSTGSSGTVDFSNLTAGTYQLTETAAPIGYNLLDTVIRITIDLDGITANGNCKVNTDSNGKVTLVVENAPGFILPETGGFGGKAFESGGLTLVLMATMLLILYLVKKRIIERRNI